MRTDTIETYLEQLAAKVPAPGGGATAALHAAQAAALVGMVAHYSDDTRFAAHAEDIGDIASSAEQLRDEALGLAEGDAAAAALTSAGKPPRVAVVVSTADESSAWYVRSIVRAAEKTGIACTVSDLGPAVTPNGIHSELAALSRDPAAAHGPSGVR